MATVDPEAETLIDGLLETALYVDDLSQAGEFYEGRLGLPRLFSDDRLVALDVGRGGVLLLFKRGTTRQTVVLPGGTIPPHNRSGPVHLAFAVSVSSLARIERLLAQDGIPIEGRTRWPRGGLSLYVRDPDDHLVEFATPGLWSTY